MVDLAVGIGAAADPPADLDLDHCSSFGIPSRDEECISRGDISNSGFVDLVVKRVWIIQEQDVRVVSRTRLRWSHISNSMVAVPSISWDHCIDDGSS